MFDALVIEEIYSRDDIDIVAVVIGATHKANAIKAYLKHDYSNALDHTKTRIEVRKDDEYDELYVAHVYRIDEIPVVLYFTATATQVVNG